MILDTYTEFASAASVANAAATINVGNVIDLHAAGRDIGVGHPPLYLNIICTTSIITAGSAGTIAFRLVSDDGATPNTSTASVHWTSPTFVTDGDDANALDAGDIIASIALPTEGSTPYERYLGIQAIIASQEVTAGAIDAFLSFNQMTAVKHYAEATN